MKTRSLTRAQMDAERDEIESRPRYAPGAEGRGTARLRFDLDPRTLGDTFFAIESQRAGALVYAGAYHPDLLVGKDSGLTSHDGLDVLRFVLFELDHGRVRTWTNDVSSPIWAAEGPVSIALLDESRFDEDNLLVEYEVTS